MGRVLLLCRLSSSTIQGNGQYAFVQHIKVSKAVSEVDDWLGCFFSTLGDVRWGRQDVEYREESREGRGGDWGMVWACSIQFYTWDASNFTVQYSHSSFFQSFRGHYIGSTPICSTFLGLITWARLLHQSKSNFLRYVLRFFHVLHPESSFRTRLFHQAALSILYKNDVLIIYF